MSVLPYASDLPVSVSPAQGHKTLTAATWLMNLPDRTFIIGPGLHEMFGVAPGTPMDIAFVRSVIHPADVAEPVQALERFLKEGGSYQRRYRLLLPDGRIRFVENTALVLEEEDGRPKVVTGFMRDIGEEGIQGSRNKSAANALDGKLAELTASDVLFNTALEEEKLTLFLQDANLRYLWRSNAPDSFYHVSDDGGHVTMALPDHEAERVNALKQEVIDTQKPRDVSGWYHGKNGDQRYFKATLRPYPFLDGTTGIIGSSRDLTEERLGIEKIEQYNQALEQAKQTVEELNSELSSRLQSISSMHETKLRELVEARDLQLSTLPVAPPRMRDFDMAVSMQTSEEVGGDYYDFCPIAYEGGENMVLAVGDATGHGLRAGYLVAMVKAYFQMLFAEQPEILLESISSRLEAMRLKNMYMALGVLRYESALGYLAYASAGMPPLLIYRAATGQTEQLSFPSMYLGTGLRSALKPETTNIELSSGDILLIATDGLTEARNAKAEMLPAADLHACIAAAAHQPADAIIADLKRLQTHWQGTDVPDDDTTLVVIKWR